MRKYERNKLTLLAVCAVLTLILVFLITPLRAAVVATNTYDVTGNTLKEVWDSIQANSPNPGHAPGYAKCELGAFRTDADPVVEKTEDPSCPGGYRYTVSIKRTITWSIKTTITLPKWTGYDSACKEVKAEWDRFLAALTTHEQGHDQVSEDALKNAKPLTTIIGVGSDCNEATAVANAQADLKAKYAAEGKRLQDAIDAANTKYDTDTKNGATQGAVLNVSVGCPDEPNEPYPEHGAIDVPPTPALTWKPGMKAVTHDVYFGADIDKVTDANRTVHPGLLCYSENQDANNYTIPAPPAPLEWGKTYYWRIDEVNDLDPNSPWRGDVWSFTTRNYLIVDDFESYNNTDPNIIYKTWKDGKGYPDYPGNGTGSQAGYRDPNYAEMTIIHGGAQSMPFDYNNLKPPYDSNATRTFVTDQNWTAQGVKALSLWLRGYQQYVGSFVGSPAGTYTMTASGEDINIPDWRHPSKFRDEFHYAYMQVSGDCAIVAKVESITNTNAWAKAGVMIRDSLDPNSTHGIMCVMPTSGVAFQWRLEIGGANGQDGQNGYAPCWLSLQRTYNETAGNYETIASYSSCGPAGEPNNWQQLGGSINISMADPVYIGLAVTAHNAAATCTAVFSNVTVYDQDNNPVTPSWTSQDIGIKSNTAAPLYVTLQDSSTPAKTATVTNSDPNIVLQNTWQAWDIALSDFTGVDMTKIKKITIGVGHSTPRGTGTLYFDDIRLYLPRCMPGRRAPDLTGSDCLVDYQDLQILTNNWLSYPADPNIDLHEDGTIDLRDYAVFASKWLEVLLWP
jgi:predicted secreted Zn-dependent protease